MNRKQTILLAIFMNGALLVVLFLSALSSPEEIAIAPTHEAAKPQIVSREEPPLFTEDLAVAKEVNSKAAAPTVPQELQAPLAEAPLVHTLPPVAPITKSEPEAPPIASKAAAPVQASLPAQTNVGVRQVTVKKGDSLEKIAKAHNTTVDEIIKINQLPSSFLRVGQVLKIPEPKAGSQPTFVTKQVEKQANGPEYYVVKVGDNPWTIAMKHHLKVEELLKLNGLNEEKARKLKPGDRLRIR